MKRVRPQERVELTVQQALAQSLRLQSMSDSWRLDGELLLCQVLGKPREYLFTWPEKKLTAAQGKAFSALLGRREAGEPIAYILGRRAFWDFEFKVTPAVLIPRPESELLVNLSLELLAARRHEAVQIADLGTGSGALAISIAAASDCWQLTAIERSENALEVARENARLLHCDNVDFLQSHWGAEAIRQGLDFDLIVSNPPYVAESDRHLEQGDVRFEPREALVAKDRGLSDIGIIVEQSRQLLKPGGWLLIEHGFDQAGEVERLFTNAGYRDVECFQDLNAKDRVTRARAV